MPANIPPILLEGDQEESEPVGSQAASAGSAQSCGALPEAYGTGRLFLVPRDPHWLYAHWDFTRDQQRRYNSLAADRHLALRVYIHAVSVRPIEEIPLHPESRDWMVHVAQAKTRYLVELGYRGTDGQWSSISTSQPVVTPPDRISEVTTAEFATIPGELPLSRLALPRWEFAQTGRSSPPAVGKPPEEGGPERTAVSPAERPEWTPEQEHVVKELSQDPPRSSGGTGSFEIAQSQQPPFPLETMVLSSADVSITGSPEAGWIAGSQPVQTEKLPTSDFRFTVNTDLVVYGSTEPGASVTIGDRPVSLQPDGSFSCRIALPDGQFELPVVAVSRDRCQVRRTVLKLSRTTEQHPGSPPSLS